MRILVLLLCLLGAPALLAAPAAAVTTVTSSGSQLDVAADPVAPHDITIEPGAAPGTVRIGDAGDTVTAPGCGPVDAGTVECALPGSVKVTLGGASDTLTATASPVKVEVDGGAGDDRITGGANDDTLTGGSGADTIAGGAGRDVLHVGDATADTVACGPGADDASDADAADAVAPDALTDCEETPATAGNPNTFVVSGPATATKSTTAAFLFSATEPGVSFECALDGAPFAGCGSEKTFTGLAAGHHTLEVRAIDLIGNTDPAPASWEWTVDTQAPAVTLTDKPRASTNETGADFAFSVSEPAATAECRLDGGAWVDCAALSAAHYTSLSEAAHSFAVRVTDAAGNAGSAGFAWTVDLTAPRASFTARPAAVSADATPAFGVSVSEPATIECNLDGSGFAPCSQSPSYAGLVDGAHDLKVSSTDDAGNASVIAATWTQDTVRPQTQLTGGPATSAPVSSGQATLTFASPDGASFECSLDGAAWQACASPVAYRGLANGAHTFAVRAVDAAGNVDGTPAARAWTVKVDGGPTARIVVTSDADGFVLDAGASTDPERGALTYRWVRNGAAAGSTGTLRYAPPAGEARDAFTVTVTDRSGLQSKATVVLSTRMTTETAAHEAVEVIRFGSGTRLAAGARARIAALRSVVASASAVRIEGHARPGPDAARVSRARAQTVRRLLVKGVTVAPRISVAARGATDAAASNATAAGRARNDRVLVTVGYDAEAERLVTEQEGNPSVRHTSAPPPVAAASGAAPKLFAFYSAVPGALRRLQEVGGRIDVLAPNWYSLSPANGTVRGGTPNARVMALSRQLRFDVWPVVNATMNGSPLIDSAAGRTKIVKRISALAARHRLDGVTLDMEEMLPRQQAAFSALVAQLGSVLHRKHRRLGVYAVRRTDTEVTDSAAAYDWPALARAADLVLASGYNEHSANGTPGPVTTQAGFDRLTRFAASVSRTKVAPTLGAFGYQWGLGPGRMVSSADAERRWPAGAEVGSADGRSQTTGSVRTYFESAEDLWAREQAARRAGAKWIGLFTLGREPERYWERSAIR
jgi:outer membrane protein OmpA-like peptidoglycan-associated protein